MNYQVCTACVMDTSDPGISFDGKGLCDHCRDFETNIRPYWDTGERGRRKLEETISTIRRQGAGQEFDCILGLSGGLDSSYMLYKIVTDFGLRPLVFHVDGGWNSEIAVHNINALIDRLGLDLYTEVINWEEMRLFQLAWLRAGVPHIDIPQDHAFIATLYKFAAKHRIRWILNGGNISTEVVKYPLNYYYYGTDMRHIRDILRQFGAGPLKSYPFSSIFRHKIYLRYFQRIRVFKPLNHVPYTRTTAIETLQKACGWKSYPQKHFESRFTRFFEGYWLPVRFGFDVRRVQWSSLILTGQMQRAEALALLEKPPYDAESIEHDFKYIATKLGISVDELRHYLTLPKKHYWDYRNNERVMRIGAAILAALRLDRSPAR